MKEIIGGAVLFVFGIVVLITCFATQGGLPVYVLGGLLALSGVLVIVNSVLKKKNSDIKQEEKKND